MSDLDLSVLRGIAEAATPGEWEFSYDGDTIEVRAGSARTRWNAERTFGTVPGSYASRDMIAERDVSYMDEDEADGMADDATHIAAFDPPTILALLSRLEAAEKVIAEALDVFRPGASVPLGVSEARHFDRLLAEGHRILSAYTKGTDRD